MPQNSLIAHLALCVSFQIAKIAECVIRGGHLMRRGSIVDHYCCVGDCLIFSCCLVCSPKIEGRVDLNGIRYASDECLCMLI